jgi:hypothetical protein
MAQQLENSLDRFAPRQASSMAPLLAVAVGVLLFVGVIVALASEAYALTGILASSLAGFGALAYISLRNQKRLLGSRAAGWLDWETALPDLQRQNLNIAVGELARALKAESPEDLRSPLIVAVDLALRQMQQGEGVPVLRHIGVAGMPFDAVFLKGDVLVCGEVSFLVSPEFPQERVVAMMKKIAAVKRSVAAMNVGLNVRLLVVIVTQMSEEEIAKLRGTLSTSRFSSTLTDVDIRLMDFEELQRTFVS